MSAIKFRQQRTRDQGLMEQIRAILKGINALARLVIVGILLYSCVSTTGDFHMYAVSNDAVARVVHDALAGDHDATPLNGSPVVDCTGERNCTIGYTVQQPMGGLRDQDGGADLQLVKPTRQIWKALFTDPQFQSGTIRVRGPVTTIGGKAQTGAYYLLTCDRDSASHIDWNNVDGKGIRNLCDYQAQTQGLPGYILPGAAR
jgi:hypothetical protein